MSAERTDEESRVAELAAWQSLQSSGHWQLLVQWLEEQRSALIVALDKTGVPDSDLRKLVGELVQNEKLRHVPATMIDTLTSSTTSPPPDDPAEALVSRTGSLEPL